jgi:catechol 2,3-dioxygenase-like lactoylglutathione lyase family enzyme
MIDHVYVSVSDPIRSLAFYAAVLKPLGWREFGNYDGASGPDTVPSLWGLTDGAAPGGQAIKTSIWLRERNPGETGLYLGLVADSPAEVDAAYAAALEAGGKDDGAPAIREYFSDGYYAANVVDFDGNRLEFVNKAWNPKKPV